MLDTIDLTIHPNAAPRMIPTAIHYISPHHEFGEFMGCRFLFDLLALSTEKVNSTLKCNF